MGVNNLSYSESGLNLTKNFEGLRLTAYLDSGGVVTIGYGHTGPHVFMGQTITLQEAVQFLIQDIASSVQAVNKLVTVKLQQNQFDSLVDFTFNLGAANLQKSTLLKYINAGNFSAAANEFKNWALVHGQSKPNAGLLRRRLAETSLFVGGTIA